MGDNARLHDHEKLVAADEINDIKHLRVKMQFGGENTAIDVSPANPLPVSGGVSITSLPEVEIKNDLNNPIPVSFEGGIVVSGITISNISISNVTIDSSCESPVYTSICQNEGDYLPVSVILPSSTLNAFGELHAQPITPLVQTDAIYGIDSNLMISQNVGTGSVGSDSGLWRVSSGTNVGDFGYLRTIRFAKYRPGQGMMARYTAAFPSKHVAGVLQKAYVGNQQNEYGFGYSGLVGNRESDNIDQTQFGIYHIYDGLLEIRSLKITVAPNAPQTVTVTLDGVSYNVVLSAGTVQYAAYTIANVIYNDSFWRTDQINDTITFQRKGNYSGTFSITSTGNCTGTWTRNQIGSTGTTVWHYQNEWNGTPLPPSFKPEYLNVYQIDYRYLGAGIVRFMVEHPDTGDWVEVHTQHWVSRYATPHVNNPSFRIGYRSEVISGNPANTQVTGASAMSALEGFATAAKPSESYSRVVTTTLAKDVEHCIAVLRNPWTQFDSQVSYNTQEIIVEDFQASAQGNDPIVFKIYIDSPTISGGTLNFQALPGSWITANNTSGLTVSSVGTVPIATLLVGINGFSQFDLMRYRMVVGPGQNIVVTATSTSSINKVAVSLAWNPE